MTTPPEIFFRMRKAEKYLALARAELQRDNAEQLLRSQIGWHPADGPKPDPFTPVIVAKIGGECREGFWDTQVWRWASQGVITDAIAWCPIPQLPKALTQEPV